jgi:hypothetical protein
VLLVHDIRRNSPLTVYSLSSMSPSLPIPGSRGADTQPEHGGSSGLVGEQKDRDVNAADETLRA